MSLHHIVTLSSESALGLDRYDHNRANVCCAFSVLKHLEKPKGDPNDFATKWALVRYEEAETFLRSLGDAMVDVYPAGALVGEYAVQPFLVGKKMYDALKKMKVV